VLIEVTLDDLQAIVDGLAGPKKHADLRQRLASVLHVERIDPRPAGDVRRTWWRSWKDGVETGVEFYKPETCDRIDAAVERIMRPRKKRR